MDESAPTRRWHNSGGARGSELLSAHRATLARVKAAVAALKDGRLVIVVGDRHSGFVGALIGCAEQTTAEVVNFLITHGRGPLYVNAEAERLDALGLALIRPHRWTLDRAGFHESADYLTGTTTGLTASDRAATIRAIADPSASPTDFRVPGHLSSIGARRWGVLERPGHTEASVDLVRLAGREPVAVSCAILSEDGDTASVDEIRVFAARHGLSVISIADVCAYRREHEAVIDRMGEARVPVPQGAFRAVGYSDRFEWGEHLALVMGELHVPGPMMIRVHTECLAGDTFASTACSCRVDLLNSIDEVAESGRGVLLYIRSPGGDRARLRHMEPALAPALRDFDHQAVDTAVNGIALSILKDLGLTTDRLRAESSG